MLLPTWLRSTNALARDIQRHLADEPVEACPPSAGNKLRKLARKNKPMPLIVTAVALAMAMLTGSIGWVILDRAVRQGAIQHEANAALREAALLQQQRKYPEAEAKCREAIRLKPDCVEAHHNLGIALNDQGKLSEAETEYREAIRLEPGLVDAHNGLGVTLLEQGKLSEAEAECQEAIHLKPDDAHPHNNLGAALCKQGKLSEAEAECREAIRLKPDDAITHSNLGVALNRQGKLSEAEAEYREAIGLEPDLALLHNNLGVVLCKQGKLAEAEAECREAIRLKPDLADAHNTLGMVQYRSGQWQAALTTLIDCESFDVGNKAAALLFRAMACCQLDKLDQATTSYEKAESWMRDHPQDVDNNKRSYQAEAAALLRSKGVQLPDDAPGPDAKKPPEPAATPQAQ